MRVACILSDIFRLMTTVLIYLSGIALAKSSQSTDYKVALTTSPSSYRHTLPQTVQAAGLMSSAEFAYKAQVNEY